MVAGAVGGSGVVGCCVGGSSVIDLDIEKDAFERPARSGTICSHVDELELTLDVALPRSAAIQCMHAGLSHESYMFGHDDDWGAPQLPRHMSPAKFAPVCHD